MARIAGVDLPNKHVEIALTYIFGLGRTSARKICETAKIDPNRKINDLSNEEVNELRKVIENDYKVEGRLRSETALNIKRLMDIGCYRGLRHRKGLPVRRPAHADERAHPQGQEEDRGEQEERPKEGSGNVARPRRRKRRRAYTRATSTSRRPSTIRSSRSPTSTATRFPGAPPAASASAARRSPPPSRPRPSRSRRYRRPSTWVSARCTCT